MVIMKGRKKETSIKLKNWHYWLCVEAASDVSLSSPFCTWAAAGKYLVNLIQHMSERQQNSQ